MAVLWAVVAFVVLAVVGDLASEEIRSRLERLPKAILRLGALRLPTVVLQQ